MHKLNWPLKQGEKKVTITEKIRTMAGQFENEDLEILERMLNLCGEYVEKVNR